LRTNIALSVLFASTQVEWRGKQFLIVTKLQQKVKDLTNELESVQSKVVSSSLAANDRTTQADKQVRCYASVTLHIAHLHTVYSEVVHTSSASANGSREVT
jgi:hypothetical protein